MVRIRVTKDAVDNLQNIKDRLDKTSEIAKKLDTPPPSGLIPIGDTGLYRTPEVIDPRDCEHYPDSLWCGGNPITRDAVGLDFDYGADGCSVHASVTPKLGYLKLPTHTIAWIKEECREKYSEKEEPPKIPNPEIPSEWKAEKPDQLPSGFAADDIVCAATATLFIEKQSVFNDSLQRWEILTTTIEGLVEGTNYPSDLIAQSPQGFGFPPRTALCDLKGRVTYTTSSASITATSELRMHPQLPRQGQNGGWVQTNFGATGGLGDYRALGFNNYGVSVPLAFCLYYGRFGSIFPSKNLPFEINTGAMITRPEGSIEIVQNGRIAFFKVSLVFLKKLEAKDNSKIPKDRRKRDCCMQCCGSQTGQGAQRQQQDLEDIKKMLRQILKNQGDFPYSVALFDTNEEKQGAQTKNVSVGSIAKATKLAIERTEKTNKMVGIDEFPIYVPGSIINDESNGIFGDLKDLKNALIKKKIGSIAELIAWKVEQDNNIFGKWQEVIEIEVSPAAKDKDGRTKSPSKKERIVLPNMSRTLKELVILSQTQLKILGFVMDTTLKLAVDLAGTKIEIAQAHAVIRDIQDFLDYPTQEKLLEVPIQVTIPASTDSVDDKEDLQRFLTESKAKAKYEDWTGEQSLNDLMVSLLDAAAMIRAVFYQKT